MGKKLIIIRGNSGSGKTEISRLIHKRMGPGTMLVSQDAVRREMLNVPDGPDTPAAELLAELVRWGGGHGQTAVILEGILRADWYRPVFRAAMETFGEEIYAYYYDLPFEETLRRHELGSHARDFGEAEMRRWFRPRDLIAGIPETLLTADVSLEDAAERIIRDAAKNEGECSGLEEDVLEYITDCIQEELYSCEQYEQEAAASPARPCDDPEDEARITEVRRLLGYPEPELIYPGRGEGPASAQRQNVAII